MGTGTCSQDCFLSAMKVTAFHRELPCNKFAIVARQVFVRKSSLQLSCLQGLSMIICCFWGVIDVILHCNRGLTDVIIDYIRELNPGPVAGAQACAICGWRLP